jgi:hypothetical protein
MTWQTSYVINDNLKEAISHICDKKLKSMPDNQNVWHRTSHITLDSYTWSFYQAEGLKEVKKQLKVVTGLDTIYEHGYTCIWRYDKQFPKCPIHIDHEAQHKGSLCISLSGYHNIFLHDTDTKEKVESITVKDNNIMFIKNSKYYHSVEGNGDLWILGVKK